MPKTETPTTTDETPAQDAAIAEVKDPDTVTFEWEGETWTVPTKWPLEALEFYGDKMIVNMLRELLDPVQWVRFKAVAKGDTDRISDFMDAMGKAGGSGNR